MAYGIIKIGEREVPMRATAATPIRYRQVFHKNLLPYFLGKADEDAIKQAIALLQSVLDDADDSDGEDNPDDNGGKPEDQKASNPEAEALREYFKNLKTEE